MTDKAEAIANDLALLLNDWRQKTKDVIPSEFAGTRISERYTETYLRIHGNRATSRSAIAAERGIEDDHSFRAIVLIHRERNTGNAMTNHGD